MEYFPDPASSVKVQDIISRLNLSHIDSSRVKTIRSRGSKSRVLARIHSVPKAVQTGLNLQSHYVIEIVSENFDRLSEDEKTKTLIHELLHIPKTFGGGLLPHTNHVTRKAIDRHYNIYLSTK